MKKKSKAVRYNKWGYIFLLPFIISIHAPLTGSDHKGFFLFIHIQISIHAPLTGSDNKYAHKIPL